MGRLAHFTTYSGLSIVDFHGETKDEKAVFSEME